MYHLFGYLQINRLREVNLINGLKLSTKDYHSVTAFQVYLRGLQLLSQVSKGLKANVDAFVFAPKPYRRELLKIRYIPIRDPPDPTSITEVNAPSWTFTRGSDKHLTAEAIGVIHAGVEEEPEFNEEGRFILESIGYFRYSGVTETEDVSYVSSPFVPQCVRSLEAYQQLPSNANRALEAASGRSNTNIRYLLESLEFVKIPQNSPNASEEEESIFSYLDLKKQHHDILLRARDLEKLVIGAKYEIVSEEGD
ncbi:hypothetical protein PHPALM_31562 [Phytophthora palmivora]|uniref:Uncharacterized protein n=1 Tax=Phytophthora palmivora TaxID=4796 RepID=A0A2P4X297_9STRA|nr:hypothetical protein PHPALM_31562 [Phytophthora palmivora]